MSQTRKNETDILFELINMRYGERVTTDELEEIRKGLVAILDAANEMRAIKIENSDEPYQFFKPYRGE